MKENINEEELEIYIERARYLLNVDDILEQILSENNLENSPNINKEVINKEEIINKEVINKEEDIGEEITFADIDIPLIITSEFDY